MERARGERLRQMAAEMGEIGLAPRRVDDKKKALGIEPGDHQVIEDAPRLGGEHRIAHPPQSKPLEIGGDEALESGGGAGSRHFDLAHVRDVEQRRPLAAGAVFGERAGGVGHRQEIAREACHRRPAGAMKRRKRGGRRVCAQALGHPRAPRWAASAAETPLCRGT